MIVTGAHGMFSAGYDIGEIPDDEFEERAERLVAHPFTEAIDALEAFPCPTLAVLPGHTIGGGLELALACDLRVAAGRHQARACRRRSSGLVYSHTGLRRFIDAIGAARTRELFLLGRAHRRADRARLGARQPRRRRGRSSTRLRSSSPASWPATRRSPSAATSA